jgi:two-component system LytT family response regulator
VSRLSVLIVDDEPRIRSGIRGVLSGIQEIEVAGECGSGCEGVKAIDLLRPDIVLLDVQMPDCSGIEVVRQIGAARMPSVIFVTAYDEYAVSAFELNAVDYLLKPFTDERLVAAIDRARMRLKAEQCASLLTGKLEALLAHERPARQTLVVRNGERFDLVPVGTIDWIESANNYVQLHCGRKSHLMAKSLTALEQQLDGESFVRVHRRRIVNVSRIVAAYVTIGGAYELELRSGERLTTGRQYRPAVQRLLGKS